MSGRDSSCRPQRSRSSSLSQPAGGQRSEERPLASEGEDRKSQRREKNRVAAQKSRKRQTQRADRLHKACELLEQRNRKLRREVDSLSEEHRGLLEALKAHERLCPIMHCFLASSSLQPDGTAARAV